MKPSLCPHKNSVDLLSDTPTHPLDIAETMIHDEKDRQIPDLYRYLLFACAILTSSPIHDSSYHDGTNPIRSFSFSFPFPPNRNASSPLLGFACPMQYYPECSIRYPRPQKRSFSALGPRCEPHPSRNYALNRTTAFFKRHRTWGWTAGSLKECLARNSGGRSPNSGTFADREVRAHQFSN